MALEIVYGEGGVFQEFGGPWVPHNDGPHFVLVGFLSGQTLDDFYLTVAAHFRSYWRT